MPTNIEATTVAAKHQQSGASGSRQRTSIWLAMGCVGASAFALVVLILSVLVGRVILKEVRREDSVERFAELADGLLDQPQVLGDSPASISPELAIAALRQNQRVMEDLAANTRQLSNIADGHAQTIRALRGYVDPALSADARPSVGLLAVAAVRAIGGGAFGAPTMIHQGLDDGLNEVQKAVKVYDALVTAGRRTRASQWELTILARQFSAPPKPGLLITASFTTLPADPLTLFGPSRPARIDPSHVLLKNTSGVSLSNVMVVMEIRPRDREISPRQQVCWVREWPADQTRAALVFVDFSVFAPMPPEPESVSLVVWSRDSSGSSEKFEAIPVPQRPLRK